MGDWERYIARFLLSCFVTGSALGLIGGLVLEWRYRR